MAAGAGERDLRQDWTAYTLERGAEWNKASGRPALSVTIAVTRRTVMPPDQNEGGNGQRESELRLDWGVWATCNSRSQGDSRYHHPVSNRCGDPEPAGGSGRYRHTGGLLQREDASPS